MLAVVTFYGSGDDKVGNDPAGPGPLTVTVAGDLDGDNAVSDAERDEAEQAQNIATGLTDKLLPEKSARNAVSIMVTPPGEEWWDVATSYAADLFLYRVPAPKNVNWYAVTWARSVRQLDATGVHVYPAVHLAFPDEEAAVEWMNSLPTGMAVMPVVRGNVVSIVPSTLNQYREPFPQRLARIADVKQTTGFWSVDYRNRVALEAPDALLPSGYRAFWKHLGFAGASWQAVTRDPGRWVGTLTGWDADQVDSEKAAAALKPYVSDQGLLTDHVLFTLDGVDTPELDRTAKNDLGASALAPSGVPDGTDFILVTDLGFRAAVSGGLVSHFDAPFDMFASWLVGGTMTTEPQVGASTDAQSGDDKLPVQPSLDATPTPTADSPDDVKQSDYPDPYDDESTRVPTPEIERESPTYAEAPKP